MPDYSKGKIYKLVNDTTDDCYYGSTCQLLCQRKSAHNRDYKSGKHLGFGSFKLYENDAKVSIILVENYPCKSKEELLARERWYIENNECLNKRLPGRTKKEYIAANKEHVAEVKHAWYEKNKHRLDKAKDRERAKLYYQKNREAVRAKNREKVECDICQKPISREHLTRHKKNVH